MSSRASAPVGGSALLVVAVVLASAVAGVALSALPADSAGPAQAALSLSVAGDRITLTHRAGDVLDVRSLRLVVTVDGTPLTHQPPVPFFAASGFRSGPTGPFNAAADAEWSAGEEAGVRLAGTNDPLPRPGATVTVELYRDARLLVRLSATATPKPPPPS
ncbi:type IV pilin [Salinirarus marinus]|uniref:type IV pilin n=1 Tax=Salinirarus marinus TaxID=3068310 RepID=UPI003C6CA5CD